jgi:hypothetical protein
LGDCPPVGARFDGPCPPSPAVAISKHLKSVGTSITATSAVDFQLDGSVAAIYNRDQISLPKFQTQLGMQGSKRWVLALSLRVVQLTIKL